jgi:hypothetical protein
VHGISVRPEVTELDEDGYVVALRGTAALSSVARGWFKTKIAWWRSDTAPGDDIVLDVAKASKESPTGTVFDAALYWAERSPGKGEPIWSARYRVRNTSHGPELEELDEEASVWSPAGMRPGADCRSDVTPLAKVRPLLRAIA